MTPDEWLTEPDFARHVRFVEERLSVRKRRLLAVAFCHRTAYLHTHFDIATAVGKAENFADGKLHRLEPLEPYRQACREAAVRFHETWTQWVDGPDPAEERRWWMLHELAWAAAYTASTPVPVADVGQRVAAVLVSARTGGSGVFPGLTADPAAQEDHIRAEVNAVLRALVWDVAGNPFAPVTFDPAWRTSAVVALAGQMYESGEFGSMPILADALDDAGCDNDDIINHCRDSNWNHVRGCWVLDLVLGKG
jgi:hypothetical protein